MWQKYDHTFRTFVMHRHKVFLVFISNSIPGFNICLNILTYRSFDLIKAMEDLRETIILKLPTHWILEWKKRWLHKARDLTCCSLFMLMSLLLPLLLFQKKKKSCIKTYLCWCQHRLGVQKLCSEHLFIFIKNIFSIRLPRLWQLLTDKKQNQKNPPCKIINIAIPPPPWKLHTNQILVSIRPIIIYKKLIIMISKGQKTILKKDI